MKRLVILLVMFLVGCTAGVKQPIQEIEAVPEMETHAPDASEADNMKLTSPDFENEGMIPARFTCDGEDINPELLIEDVPEGTKSLVLIVDDPDAPNGNWNHWVVWNLPPDIGRIPSGVVFDSNVGRNSWGKNSYGGPCPPSGVHRYFFKLYALDAVFDIPQDSDKEQVEGMMMSDVIAQAVLMGRYQR